jgi:hypothetical protein
VVDTTETPSNGASSGAAMATTTAGAPPVRRLWQRPSVTMARSLLAGDLWSGRVIAEAAGLSGFFLLAFSEPGRGRIPRFGRGARAAAQDSRL